MPWQFAADIGRADHFGGLGVDTLDHATVELDVDEVVVNGQPVRARQFEAHVSATLD